MPATKTCRKRAASSSTVSRDDENKKSATDETPTPKKKSKIQRKVNASKKIRNLTINTQAAASIASKIQSSIFSSPLECLSPLPRPLLVPSPSRQHKNKSNNAKRTTTTTYQLSRELYGATSIESSANLTRFSRKLFGEFFCNFKSPKLKNSNSWN